jgi:hypothetical protein
MNCSSANANYLTVVVKKLKKKLKSLTKLLKASIVIKTTTVIVLKNKQNKQDY